MGNDDRSKLSWRDIDKRRDGSSGRVASSGPADMRSGSHEEHRQKQYRAALEAAFAKGELGKLADKLNISGYGPTSSPPPPPPAPSPPPSEPSADAAADSAAASPAAPTTGKPGGRKKVEDERVVLRRKLVEAAGRQEISRAAEKYLARYPLPDDHELLEQLLEHERESRIKEAIERIIQLIERRQMPRRSRALCGKLKYIIETSPDSDLRQAAEGLLGRLG
jgi:hypothetical protein